MNCEKLTEKEIFQPGKTKRVKNQLGHQGLKTTTKNPWLFAQIVWMSEKCLKPVSLWKTNYISLILLNHDHWLQYCSFVVS